MKDKVLTELLYEWSKDEVLNYIPQINNARTLFLYAYNYNWDNGFEIPNAVLNNPSCELSTALLMFYNADGYSFLIDKNKRILQEYNSFTEKCYDMIIDGHFEKGNIGYEIPLTKAQLFKLNKVLSEEEKVLINRIDGEQLNIVIYSTLD